MSKTKLSRREREHQRHRQEILEVAIKLFSDKGFYNVSMQEIAEKSEFAVGTLYKFFESKDALFEDIINNGEEKIYEELSQLLDIPGTAKQRLKAFINYHPDFQSRHSAITRLYISELGITAAKMSKFTKPDRIQQFLNAKISEIITEGIDEGVFRAVDPEIATKCLLSTIETLIFETSETLCKENSIEIFEKVETLFLNGLLLPKEHINKDCK